MRSPFSVGCLHRAAAFTFIDFFSPFLLFRPGGNAAAAAAPEHYPSCPLASSSHLFSLRFSFSFALWTERAALRPLFFFFSFLFLVSFGSRLHFSMLTKPRGTRSPWPGRNRFEYRCVCDLSFINISTFSNYRSFFF